MRPPDRFEFTATASDQREGMLAGSKTLLKGRKVIRSALVTGGLTVLSGLGGMALATFITSWADVSPSWWVVAGWFIGGGLYLGSFQLLYSEMAKEISQRPLHRAPQAITFDQNGVTYEATPAVWTTPWSMVDDVIETKNTITIVVSGIAFGLPKTAVGDTDAVDTLIRDIKEQIAHA